MTGRIAPVLYQAGYREQHIQRYRKRETARHTEKHRDRRTGTQIWSYFVGALLHNAKCTVCSIDITGSDSRDTYSATPNPIAHAQILLNVRHRRPQLSGGRGNPLRPKAWENNAARGVWFLEIFSSRKMNQFSHLGLWLNVAATRHFYIQKKVTVLSK